MDKILIGSVCVLRSVIEGKSVSPTQLRDALADLEAYPPEEILAEAKRQASLLTQENEQPHKRTAPVLIGGVFRCCLATLDESLVLEEEGEVLPCKFCRSSLIFKGGQWQWNKKGDKS